jgi:hypothetical protein
LRAPLSFWPFGRQEGPVRRFTIDARNVRSFRDFVDAANAGFIEQVGGKWNGNLDAFNDYLSWPEEQQYELELLGAADCARNLGHAAQAAWLQGHLRTCHPSNRADFQSRIALAEAGRGETLFDVLKKIIEASSDVRLLLG